MHTYRFAVFILLTVFLVPASLSQSLPSPTPVAPPASSSFHAPATYLGTLPCADCPAIHESLHFLPDGIYIDRLVYEERNTSFQSIGRWSINAEENQLTLRSGDAAPVIYAILGVRSLRKVPPKGSRVPAKYLPVLDLDFEPYFSSDPIAIRGEFLAGPHGPILTECQSGVDILVSHDSDATALNQAYSDAHLPPGSSLLVSLTAKFFCDKTSFGPINYNWVTRLEVIHFEASYPGKSCALPAS